MASNSVKVTLQIRRDTAENWAIRNPVLAEGEYALEINTKLLKIGDGVRDWEHLPYLNKLDSEYFTLENDGTLTFSGDFKNTITALEAIAGQAITSLIITEPPVNDTDVPNKKYVDDAIAAAGHLKREIVSALPSAAIADPDTLYMILAADGTHYEEYMVINGTWDKVGATGDGGNSGGLYELPIASSTQLGGVLADDDPKSYYLNVTQEGFMTFNRIPTTKLYVPTGDVLIIYGGSA